LGVDSSTLVNFNRKIKDRIIPIKDAPTTPTNPSLVDRLKPLSKSLNILSKYFLSLNSKSNEPFDINKTGEYRNALKDIIAFFRTVVNSSINNRAILPTVLSIEMDGIGGIIIGNVFKIPKDILPKGYKGGDGPGSQLGHIVTGLGHSLQNGDWITRIEAQTIILDSPAVGIRDFDYANIDFSSIIAPSPTQTTPTQQPTGTNSVPMKIALDSVMGKGGLKGYCARYTYSIAYDFIATKLNKPTKGVQVGKAGSANTTEYRNALLALGKSDGIHYEMTYYGNTVTKNDLLKLINNPQNIGDIINYRAVYKDPTYKGSDSYYTIGHTQIYTGQNGSNWESSYNNNYQTSMVYNSINVDRWEVFVFKIVNSQ
jgi:hypothetical protein